MELAEFTVTDRIGYSFAGESIIAECFTQHLLLSIDGIRKNSFFIGNKYNMGRFKQRGGSFLPNIGLPDNGIGWTIFILAILLPLAGFIALLGFPLHWYDKISTATSYSNAKSLLSDNLSVSLTSPTPKNCSADKLGCIPTGVTIGVSPSSSKFNPAASYLLVWKGQGFYEDNGEAFQKNGTAFVGKTNATTLDIDTGRQITGMSGSVYMKTIDGSSTGPVASFSYKSPASTRH